MGGSLNTQSLGVATDVKFCHVPEADEQSGRRNTPHLLISFVYLCEQTHTREKHGTNPPKLGRDYVQHGRNGVEQLGNCSVVP